MQRSVSILIQTYNEADNIKECFESARLVTNDILVVDTGSTDNTLLIAQEENIKVLTFPYAHYVEPARQFGIEKSQGDWIVILDADERISPELAIEIKEAITKEHVSYYKIPRKNIFGRKRWLTYGGWWPDYQIRLIEKKALVRWPTEIHSTPQINGTMGYLTSPLIHYFHGSIASMVEKTATFEDVEAELLYRAGHHASVLTFFRKYFGELYRRLFRSFGFLDGSVGVIEAFYQAYSKTITYLYLYEKKKSGSV